MGLNGHKIQIRNVNRKPKATTNLALWDIKYMRTQRSRSVEPDGENLISSKYMEETQTGKYKYQLYDEAIKQGFTKLLDTSVEKTGDTKARSIHEASEILIIWVFNG
jgi:hypothetical protein